MLFRSRRLAEAMGRGTHLRVARQVQKTREGLGVPESQGARILVSRIDPPHAQKVMQSSLNSPDRWGDWGLGQETKKAAAPVKM